MKSYFLSLFVLLTLSVGPVMYGAQQSKTKLENRLSNSHVKRPRAPDTQSISCEYYEGTLALSFARADGECSLIIIDNETGAEQYHYFDSSEFFICLEVGTLYDFNIKITTSSRKMYYGNICVNH